MAQLVTEVEARLRPGFDGIASDRLNAMLLDASGLVIEFAATAGIDINPDNVPAGVRVAIIGMTRRGLANPLQRNQETLGDYSYSTQSGASGVYMTADDEKTIRRAIGMLGAVGVGLSVPMAGLLSEQLGESL